MSLKTILNILEYLKNALGRLSTVLNCFFMNQLNVTWGHKIRVLLKILSSAHVDTSV